MKISSIDIHNTLLDVLIIGAGLSGISTACWIKRKCPSKKYAILESREVLGGTWDVFRFPGVRADTDVYTLSFDFKPLTYSTALPDGSTIRKYLVDVAVENGITDHIHFGYKATKASWSSTEMCWTIEAQHKPSGLHYKVRSKFLYICSGYFRYDEAHRPVFDGEMNYEGQILSSQFWPDKFDFANKNIVVIGSGATAVTIVPALAKLAAHVTMLQRSPSYIVEVPSENKVFKQLGRFLPFTWAHKIARFASILESEITYWVAINLPDITKEQLIKRISNRVGAGFDVTTHFTPKYKPWDQRICVTPDGDLFDAIISKKVSIKTEEIDHFTSKGLKLKSGQELNADIVILATGLKFQLLGEISLTVDEVDYKPEELMIYKGVMLSNIPNLAIAFGYSIISWTLRIDLAAKYVCRLIKYMDRHNYDCAFPVKQIDVKPEPILSLISGYVQRAKSDTIHQGDRDPWKLYQNYFQDIKLLYFSRIADKIMSFSSKKSS